MPLTTGSRLGSYEILSLLGEGGMGVVYRARDTKLKRDVALKVLPDAFAQDGERMARFEREAQLLAALKHPNIAAIYGLEESGGVRALVYVSGQSVSNDAPISWMDRQGKTTPLRATPANWANLLFAPDGRRLALDIFDGKQTDVWVYDWARYTLSRLTFDPTEDAKPVWTPDARRIVFASRRADQATVNLYWQRADGTGDVHRLTESKNQQDPASWHPSGKFLAFWEFNPQTGADLMILPMVGDEPSGWKPGKRDTFAASVYTGRHEGPGPAAHPQVNEMRRGSTERLSPARRVRGLCDNCTRAFG